VPEGKAEFAVSPVLLMKDRKSDIEVQGMQNAHIRDAVALCQFLSMLEEGVSYNKFNSQNTHTYIYIYK
jgi:Xaa-Pro aminopeptidase